MHMGKSIISPLNVKIDSCITLDKSNIYAASNAHDFSNPVKQALTHRLNKWAYPHLNYDESII